MKDFSHRLNEAATAAGFTDVDLSLWFDSNYGTVRAWRQGRNVPHPVRTEQLEQRLKWRVAALRTSRLPIPLSVHRDKRPAYVLKTRQLHEKRS